MAESPPPGPELSSARDAAVVRCRRRRGPTHVRCRSARPGSSAHRRDGLRHRSRRGAAARAAASKIRRRRARPIRRLHHRPRPRTAPASAAVCSATATTTTTTAGAGLRLEPEPLRGNGSRARRAPPGGVVANGGRGRCFGILPMAVVRSPKPETERTGEDTPPDFECRPARWFWRRLAGATGVVADAASAPSGTSAAGGRGPACRLRRAAPDGRGRSPGGRQLLIPSAAAMSSWPSPSSSRITIAARW